MTKIDSGYKALYDSEAERTDLWKAHDRMNLYYKEVVRYERAKELISKKNAKILDLGCGDGFFSVMLAKDGHKVTAADLSRTRLDKFKDKAKKFKIKQVRAEASKLPFADDQFDYIFMLEIVEHLPNSDAVLKEARRVLKKGGQLIISVPHKENLTRGTYQCPHCEKKFHLNGHLQSFDLDKVKKMIRAAGLKYRSHIFFRNRKTELFRLRYNLRTNWFVFLLDKIYSQRHPELCYYLGVIAEK